MVRIRMNCHRHSLRNRPASPWLRVSYVSVLLILLATGCSKSQPAGGTNGEATGTTAGPAGTESSGTGRSDNIASSTASSSVSGMTKRRRDEVWVDDNGQKWFGNVPMDAFYDKPYEVATNQTPIGGAGQPDFSAIAQAAAAMNGSTASTPMVADAAGTETPAPASPSETSAGTGESDGGWGELITITALDEEIKSLRNFLNENVHQVGTYNSSMLMIPPKAATIGVLAAIAMEHPDSVSWRDDAIYVRDLAKQMNASTLQRGAKDQKRLEELYDAISDTLNRSRPANLKDPPASDSYADVAEMRLLMMRMEDSEKRLKTEAGTAGSMSAKKDMVMHEASMLAVLSKIIAMPGYGYEDDDRFTGMAENIVKASVDARSAAESGDFAAYESAMTRISTTCSNCHSDYRNN